MQKRQNLLRIFFASFIFFNFAQLQSFETFSNGFFTVEVASENDSYYLREVFKILDKARTDLRQDWGYELNNQVIIKIHPNLSSFIRETEMPWYVAAIADRDENRIDCQRLRVLIERRSLEKTLRHELFHLAQPSDWPRWRAEGSAMLFAREPAQADAILDISEEDLDRLLENATNREELQRANATAVAWVIALRENE